jgi:hypothetical protein
MGKKSHPSYACSGHMATPLILSTNKEDNRTGFGIRTGLCKDLSRELDCREPSNMKALRSRARLENREEKLETYSGHDRK